MTRHLPALLVLAFAACSKSNSNGGTGPGPTGSLDVTITAPAGVTGKVMITTPSDSVITITSSQTLNGLAPGEYLVRSSAGVTADPIVGTGYTGAVTGSPANVTAGQTASATVTYSAPRANAGVLWVVNYLGWNLAGFSTTDLAATGTPTPSVMIGNGTGTSSVRMPYSVAVDSAGGVWWVNQADTIHYFSPAQLATSSNAAPSRALIDPSAHMWVSVAFDPSGNLWVADSYWSNVKEFTAAQLASGGQQTPAVVLSTIVGTINFPWAIAFDKHGDLWVVSRGDSSVVGYAPSQLQTSGAPVPFAGVSRSKGIGDAVSLAFDAQGNLWVASLGDTVVRFTPDQLSALATPTPGVILKMPSLTGPSALAFDNSGALWVAGYDSHKLLKFTSNQLTSTGSPVPAVTISNNVNTVYLTNAMTFSPSASNIPTP